MKTRIEEAAREWLEDEGQMTDHEDDYLDAFIAGADYALKDVKEMVIFVKEVNRIATEYPDFFSMGDNIHSCVNEYSELLKRIVDED